MHLGTWGRLVVLGIGCSVVLVCLIIVICFVHPSCFGFGYLERASKRKKNDALQAVKLDNGTIKKSMKPVSEQFNWLEQGNYVLYQTGYRKPDRSSEINQRCAPFSPPLGDEKKPSTASLKIRLFYKSLNGDNTMGRLSIHLLEANSLPYREYFSSLDPYVVLDVLNNKWSLQKSERIVHTVQSRVVRHTYNPKFDQTFLFDVKKNEVKDWCLKFTLFDRDHLTRRNPICEKRVYIRDIKNLSQETGVELVEDLQPIHNNNGRLLFGISYLPTAQRLSISIIKASALKYLNVVQSIHEFFPYVRVLMLNIQGKCIKKKKTSFKQAEENPVFNETLTFDLPLANLEQAAFLVLLCSKISGKRFSSDGSITDQEADNRPKETKDTVLGAVVVGGNVRCSEARDHWITVMQNPRQVISVWHRLR